jgi:hypothetical protein
LREWRCYRAATSSRSSPPALYLLFHNGYGWSVFWSFIAAFAGIVTFRGLSTPAQADPRAVALRRREELKKEDDLARYPVPAAQVQGLGSGSGLPVDHSSLSRLQRHPARRRAVLLWNRFKNVQRPSSRSSASRSSRCSSSTLHPVRADGLPGDPADQGIRAGDAMGVKLADVRPVEARTRSRACLALAVRRGVREGGRARARRALPRRSGTGKTMLSKGTPDRSTARS